MAKVLDAKWIGVDLDRWMSDMAKDIFGEKAIKKKNAIINKGLKVAANNMLPAVWAALASRRDTGATILFTSIKRASGGGWLIATPTRDELSVFHKSAKGAKGYYPASQEFGWKHKSGRKIEGHHAMKKTMDVNRELSLQKAASFYRSNLESALRKLQKKQAKLQA